MATSKLETASPVHISPLCCFPSPTSPGITSTNHGRTHERDSFSVPFFSLRKKKTLPVFILAPSRSDTSTGIAHPRNCFFPLVFLFSIPWLSGWKKKLPKGRLHKTVMKERKALRVNAACLRKTKTSALAGWCSCVCNVNHAALRSNKHVTVDWSGDDADAAVNDVTLVCVMFEIFLHVPRRATASCNAVPL